MAEKEKEDKKENILKRLLKRKKLIAVVVVIVLAFVGWRYYSNRNGDGVETVEVKRGTVEEELILSGEIVADEHASLNFSSSGKILWVGVSEGDWVKKGQALAKLDTASLNSTYQRALSDLRSAQATVDRVHDDVKDNDDDETFTDKETRTAAEVAKDKAWEAKLIAEENLRNATLIAPFEGLVTYVANPFSGVNIIYTATQYELLNPDTIYFDVSADQSEITSLSVGQKVKVILDSFIDQEFEGEITFLSYTPKSGESGAVYKVKVGFMSNDIDFTKLRIGMTGDARFALSKAEDVLYIPVDFINTDTQGKYVRRGAKNNKLYVEIGLEGEEFVEIISDEINEGDILYD